MIKRARVLAGGHLAIVIVVAGLVGFMWIAGYILLMIFPVRRKALSDNATFLCFALANHFYARWQMPETKGRTLKGIEFRI
jgi:hypothetical protein